ncbi:DNA mismatch repair protein [Parasponia andersonii]|uniref:DNA mismatch repair protein n=1 Tax=Parasponia andersonii TaxID=3476 RepID=A0A2P5E418_PARAD|nr:DNA mismatch repair protein [Parasponia andersonii]
MAAPAPIRMKFLDWYLKISIGAALIGASMEFFMINTGFYEKVTVLESEKRAWESSPEAQAMREALNPWRNQDTEAEKRS